MDSGGCTVPANTSDRFSLKDYQFASGMDKAQSSHHCFKTYHYYKVPASKEDRLAEEVLVPIFKIGY